MNVLGKRIKLLRVQRGWKQEDVSSRLDISVPAYSKIEAGVTDVNLSRLQQLAEIYDLTVIQLLVIETLDLSDLDCAKAKLHHRDQDIMALQQQVISLFEEIRTVKNAI